MAHFLAVLGSACCSLQAISSLRRPLTQAVVEAQATVCEASSGESCGVVGGWLVACEAAVRQVWFGRMANGRQTDALGFAPLLLAGGFTELSSLLLESLRRGGSASWQLPPQNGDSEHHT